MHTTPALRRFFRDRAGRSGCAVFGLVVYGLGTYLQIQANIGLSPWNALSMGLAWHTGLSFGTASIFISLAIIGLDLLLREAIGLGTILDALTVGWAVDAFTWMGLVPSPHSLPLQLGLMLAGIVIMCVGTYLYMKPGLSCGPRDALLVALGRRLPRLSIGTINIALLAAVLLGSMALGVPPGIGTAVTVLGTGLVMDLVFRLLRFEPRAVAHENLAQSWRALRAAAKPEEAPASPAGPFQ